MWAPGSSFGALPTTQVSTKENDSLIGEVCSEEVRRAMKSIVEDKALGLGDFPLPFLEVISVH